MNYKRAFIQNSYVHLIIVAYNRQHIFTKNIQLLRDAFKNAKQHFNFDIIAICILPDHIHVILNPQNINEYPKIITSIKYYFSRNIDVWLECSAYSNSENDLKIGYKNKREKGIFQRRFFEHTILSEGELNNHINYIHYNPVKHGYTTKVKDWEYSSFHKFVKNTYYDIDWGTSKDIESFKNLDFE